MATWNVTVVTMMALLPELQAVKDAPTVMLWEATGANQQIFHLMVQAVLKSVVMDTTMLRALLVMTET